MCELFREFIPGTWPAIAPSYTVTQMDYDSETDLQERGILLIQSGAVECNNRLYCTVGKRNYFTRLIPYFTTYKFCNSMACTTVCASFAQIPGRNVLYSWFMGIKRNLLHMCFRTLNTIDREVRNRDLQNISWSMEFFIVPSLLLLWMINTTTTGSSWSRIP